MFDSLLLSALPCNLRLTNQADKGQTGQMALKSSINQTYKTYLNSGHAEDREKLFGHLLQIAKGQAIKVGLKEDHADNASADACLKIWTSAWLGFKPTTAHATFYSWAAKIAK